MKLEQSIIVKKLLNALNLKLGGGGLLFASKLIKLRYYESQIKASTYSFYFVVSM